MSTKTRLCCFDIDEKSRSILEKNDFHVYNGSLGRRVRMPNKKQGDSQAVLLNYDFPFDIHDYDVIIMDFKNDNAVNFIKDDHIRDRHTGDSSRYLLSSYPETLFNPKPYGSYLLKGELADMIKNKHLVICFTSPDEYVTYQPVEINSHNTVWLEKNTKSIYAFDEECPLRKSKSGKRLYSCEADNFIFTSEFKKLLEKYGNNMEYNQTFYHPSNWNNGKESKLHNFIPLMQNSYNEIVSLCHYQKNTIFFYFPQLENKPQFLLEFLTEICPVIMPDLFPNSTQFKWKNEKDYWLPNHGNLLEHKEKIIIDHEKLLEAKNKEISDNLEKYSFLHNILTGTGDVLVNSLIEYFKWLGFGNVNSVDEEKEDSQLLEEDIRVDIEVGILIIECKGINGTSTDADCNQIMKIKHRRCEERKDFNVNALYIVNHQKHIPPLQRDNPPFKSHQIKDAILEKRGLLSTWQLFNLYYDIEEGIISKSDAREELLELGLIQFRPKNLVYIDEPKEIIHDGYVCIVNLKEIELKRGENIFIEKDNRFTLAQIEGIKNNDKNVESAKNCEIGIKLNKPIKKKSKLWKK